MQYSEQVYRIALSLVPGIGDVQARQLVQHFGTASAIFTASRRELEKVPVLNVASSRSLLSFRDYSRAEQEVRFLEQRNIQALFISDAAYPQRLLHCADAPVQLFFKGGANLNAARIVAVVGTRSATTYGRTFTETLIRDLAEAGVLILSGLAHGIDAIAHRAALQNEIPTVGVVAHGLDRIYPYENRTLAKEMTGAGGGLLTEFLSGTDPDRHHFPLRNRIVAGMADATVVIETDVKGGSMITAKLANSYNRDVFALPGRVGDKKSAGCLSLIQQNSAALITCAADLLKAMGWAPRDKKEPVQRTLFLNLSPCEQALLTLLPPEAIIDIDTLQFNSGFTPGEVANALLHLELEGLVSSLPGKRYRSN